LLLAAIFFTGARAATAPSFDVQPILLGGATQVAPLALNDHGTVAGILVDLHGSSHGFILSGNVATLLPSTSASRGARCLILFSSASQARS